MSFNGGDASDFNDYWLQGEAGEERVFHCYLVFAGGEVGDGELAFAAGCDADRCRVGGVLDLNYCADDCGSACVDDEATNCAIDGSLRGGERGQGRSGTAPQQAGPDNLPNGRAKVRGPQTQRHALSPKI